MIGGGVEVGAGEITGLQRQLQLIRNARGLSQESRQGNHTIYGNRGRIKFLSMSRAGMRAA